MEVNTTNITQEEGTEVQGMNQEGKQGRTFTQEEVNGFVQSRISRLKGQMEKAAKAEYEQKLAELQSREMKILVKEKLDERKMPRELADIIACTDEKDLVNKLDALVKIYGGSAATKENENPSGFVQVGTGATNQEIGVSGSDPVRKAMGLDREV